MGQRSSRPIFDFSNTNWNFNFNFNCCTSGSNVCTNVDNPIQQSPTPAISVEEGIFAVMDSACDFDDLSENPPSYEKSKDHKTNSFHKKYQHMETKNDWDAEKQIKTEWVNTLFEWGVQLLDLNENLDERLLDEWLQEKVKRPSKQFSCSVTAVEE